MQPADSALDALVLRAWERLCAAGADADPALREACARVATASDFAVDTLVRDPALAAALLADSGASVPEPVLAPDASAEWPRQLRRYRAAASTRLVWRDVLGLDDVDATLAGSTRLAETCLRLALDALEAQFAQRHGVVRDAAGHVQRLVVYGLGKLGGGELNFSSDIDLVYAFESSGESDGARPLAAEDYFARLGQRLAKLLDEVSADGFCYRVDLRLRPFGNAGRIALSFAAMEHYFQREGRDWERYAWQKARPVAGDSAAGERFLDTLRPFVYRRYLDYGALDGLRAMKAAIAADVARRELSDDIKRGPGGIREIEFLAQALQLIRGGRVSTLREPRLLPALHALVEARQVAPEEGAALTDAYRFLRRLENRLQMLADAQTHALPTVELPQLRIARGLGYGDWPALREALDAHRARVALEFGALLAPRETRRAPVAFAAYWQALPNDGDAAPLSDAGFADAQALDATLRDFVRAPGVRDLSDAARTRLDRVMPALLQAAADATRPDAALRRVLALLHNILRRTSYLALLDEQPQALARLVDAVARSALLAERVAAYPLLLDELLDARGGADALPGRDELRGECNAAVAAVEDDIETALQALNEKRHALGFRIALATLDGRQPAADSVRQLAWLADAVVAVVLRLARQDLRQTHGDLPGARFAVLGYGSLGGEEIGFGSDLDLVFLFDADADAQSKPAPAQAGSARSLDAPRWSARLAQKVVALLGSVTGAGKLYEVDVRLRPDGAKGLLVSTLSSFADYQHERAWTWEHQALVRARCVAGDDSLCAEFERVRSAVLSRPRDADKLREDVSAMRQRMRGELDRSSAVRFDLKQGEGGLVDLEFLLQYLVLRGAAHAPALCIPRATPALIDAVRAAGALDPARAHSLHAAHAALSDAGLRCRLDRQPRLVQATPAVAQARGVIGAAALDLGLDFASTG